MAEKMLNEADELLLDLPYLQKVRQQGREEGLAEGKEAGLAAGIAEGLREAILDAVVLRFNPPVLEFRRVNEQLDRAEDHDQLQQLHANAIQAKDMADFIERLQKMLPES